MKSEAEADRETQDAINELMALHRHNGWFCCNEAKRLLHERIQAGLCATGPMSPTDRQSPLWCFTHNVESTPGHSYDMGSTTATSD